MNHSPILTTELEILGSDKKIIKTQRPHITLNAEIVKKNGKIITLKKDFESHVLNFAALFQEALLGSISDSTLSATDFHDTSNTSAISEGMKVNEGSVTSTGTSYYGIWIGDLYNDMGDVTPSYEVGVDVNYEDYNLRRPYTTAYGTGVDFGSVVISEINKYLLRVKRSFSNNSGKDIYISEIGLVAETKDAVPNTTYHLIARDGLNDGTNPYVVVSNGDVINIYYEFSVNSSSGFVGNYLGLLSSKFAGTTSPMTMYNLAGTDTTIDLSSVSTSSVMDSASSDAYGIMVGGKVETHPYDYEADEGAYALSSKLSNTDLSYGAMKSIAMEHGGGLSTFGFYRDFENTTTKTVYVNEVGLVIDGDTTNRFLIARAGLSTETTNYIPVEPDRILRVKFYVSFPLGDIAIPKTDVTATVN